jgi:hypothetical protein
MLLEMFEYITRHALNAWWSGMAVEFAQAGKEA